jgi:hypothetical protein
LSGDALLNASRKAANNYDAKFCSRMNIHSAHEYTTFAPAQLLHNWHEQQPSNQGNLDLSVMGEVERIYYMGMDLLLISFCTTVCHC